MAQDKYSFFRQFISSFLHGKSNAEALLQTLADESIKLHELSIAVTNQLTISTASDLYLDKRLSEVGITRPPDLGMSDLSFRNMGIQLNASKQLVESIHTILATFYGDETVRASVICGQPEPYFFEDGDELRFNLEDDEEHVVTALIENFEQIQAATAREVADLITRYIRGRGLQGYAQEYLDVDTGNKFVRIFGSAKGPYSLVQILGGQMQTEMEFPQIRGTDLPVDDTVWEITRPTGATHRFRWVSGTRPLLENIKIEDKALIFGSQFETYGIYGTFDVKNSRPAQIAPAVDAGWFEIDIVGLSTLKSSQPDQNPPPNTISATYSFTITQANFADLKFFLAKKHTAYEQLRYALAWEPEANLLKIYMPATTRVVRRDLAGSAHLHLAYQANDFNGTIGHLTNNNEKFIITGDRSIKYRENKYDNLANGGTFIVGLNTFTIDYIYRENGFVYLFTTVPHGLTGTVINGLNLYTGVANVATTAPTDDQANPFPGPYLIDPEAPYALTNQAVTIREKVLAGENKSSLYVEGSVTDQSGLLLFDLNLESQEGPVPYLAVQQASAAAPVPLLSISQVATTVTAVTTAPHGLILGSLVTIAGTSNFNGTWTVATAPSSVAYTFTKTPAAVLFETVGTSTATVTSVTTTLILDPSYNFKFTHEIGANVTVISDNKAYEPEIDGSDYGAYVTGTADGRAFAERLMEEITALGIRMEIIIIYPNDIGLGYEGGSADTDEPPTSEKVFVWGS